MAKIGTEKRPIICRVQTLARDPESSLVTRDIGLAVDRDSVGAILDSETADAD